MSMDDHYRAVAANKPPRQRRRKGFSLAGMPRDYVIRVCLQVACADCGALPGNPCVSIAAGRAGEVLKDMHGTRVHAGAALVRKKEPYVAS